MEDILEKLRRAVPEFVEYEEFDNLLYVDSGRLGTYINILYSSIIEKDRFEFNTILRKVFDFLNNVYDTTDKNIVNLVDVSIFESLLETQYGYEIAKKYMNEKMYEDFLKEYPYGEYKDSWDTDEYYSEEEYQRILNLPPPEDGD